jgi:hypothetical protein
MQGSPGYVAAGWSFPDASAGCLAKEKENHEMF